MSDEPSSEQQLMKVLSMAEECLEQGRFSFRTIREHLGAIAELGVVMKDLNQDDEQDLRNEIVEALEYVLDDLFDYMQFNCDDLKEFKEDAKEYTEIAESAMNLLERLTLSLDNPGEFNEWFQEACGETSPFELGMRLADLAEKEEEYPFGKKEDDMEPEQIMDFVKWRQMVEGFLTQLLFIETYANGLFGDGQLEKANELKERIEGIHKEWYGDEEKEEEEEEQEEEEGQEEELEQEEEEEFKLESIRSIVEAIQDNNPRKSCDEKALLIQSELEKLENVGDDLFYILVFPTSDGYVYHANLPDQVFTSLNRGQCHVIVYRSRGAKSASQQELKRMETQVTGYKALLRLLTLKLFVTQSQVDKWAQEIENNGFVIALKASTKAAIRSTKTEVLKWGPGWWVYETLLLGLLLPTKYIILAGFK